MAARLFPSADPAGGAACLPPHRETRSPGPQWLLHLRSGMPFVRLLPAPRGPSPALTRHPGGPSGSRTSRPGPGRCCAAVPGPVGWRSHPTGPGSQFHWLPLSSSQGLCCLCLYSFLHSFIVPEYLIGVRSYSRQWEYGCSEPRQNFLPQAHIFFSSGKIEST